MAFITLIEDYLSWHYSKAYGDIIGITRNFLWFVNHLFSVTDLVKSLFAPFKRLKEERVNIIKDPSGFFANLFVNFIMRIVGFVIRLAFIAVALLGFLFVFLFGVFFLLFWTGLPLLVVALFLSGITYLFP